MKPALHALALALIWSSLAVAGDEIVLKPLESPPPSEKEVFFKIADGAVRIGGEVIQEFSVREGRVSVAYKNTTEKGLFPEYVVRIYNGYGVLLGSEKVSMSLLGGSPRLEPGDIGGEKLHIEWLDLGSILGHAVADKLPEDFQQAEWLSIADSNSELRPSDPSPEP